MYTTPVIFHHMTHYRASVVYTFLTAFVMCSIGVDIPAWAQSSSSSFGSYRFERLSVEQGLSSSVVNAILQDQTGKLWFGTEDGMNEYDGMTFTTHRHMLADSLGGGANSIVSIYQDRTLALWIATGNRRCVSRFDTFTGVFEAIMLPPNAAPVHSFVEDTDGMLWMAASGGVFVFDRSTSTFHAVSLKGIPNGLLDVLRIIPTSDKTLRLIARNGIYIFDPLSQAAMKMESGIQGTCTTGALQTDNGRTIVWIGTEANGVYALNAEGGAQLYHFTPENNLPSASVRSLWAMRNGDMWIGTVNGIGIVRHGTFSQSGSTKNRSIETLRHDPRSNTTLSGNIVQALYEDASGVVWAATEFYGVNKYSQFRQKFTQYSMNLLKQNESLNSGYVRGIAEDASANLWIATQTGGVNRVNRKTGVWTYFGKNQIGSDTAWTFTLDHSGTLWLGTISGGLWQWNAAKQIFSRFSGVANIPYTASVQLIYEDRVGTLWLGGVNLLLTTISSDRTTTRVIEALRNERIFAILQLRSGSNRGVHLIGTNNGLLQYDAASGRLRGNRTLSGVSVNTLHEDASGTVWIGSRGHGVLQSSKGDGSDAYAIDEHSGLPNNIVSAILEDVEGHLWVSTKKGLAEIDRERRKVLRTYDVDDGLQGREFHRGSAFRNSRTGELFFGGTNGLNCFIPSEVRTNTVPPPVVITSVKKFGREEMLDSTMRQNHTITLRHDENSLSFSFVALDFNAPETNQYAYRLDGMDKGWIQCGNRQEATYTSLDAGEYTFHVRATNNDGVWNDAGATLRVIVNPPIWRTWWFIGLSAASGICVAFVAYRARIRSIEAHNIWLERQIEDRTAEITMANAELKQSLDEINILSSVLEGERAKAENLLLNILPPSIAERLQWGEAIVDTFESATVIFTDMVGFTKIAARVSAEELITMLNRMFSEFDRLAEKHNVEKIKTIGDAYMAVAGVPIPSDNHTESIADMALDMLEAIRSIAENEGLPINIRVGIHTGKLTAGVIGEKKFAYDLWGDTVNTASRMESSGEAGRVHCSEVIYVALKDKYDFEERGTIEVKGKGAMKTYFILRKKNPLLLQHS
jgi:class 3 adenylate cyclase/ligand-binding sensor domain-containing protein